MQQGSAHSSKAFMFLRINNETAKASECLHSESFNVFESVRNKKRDQSVFMCICHLYAMSVFLICVKRQVVKGLLSLYRLSSSFFPHVSFCSFLPSPATAAPPPPPPPGSPGCRLTGRWAGWLASCQTAAVCRALCCFSPLPR